MSTLPRCLVVVGDEGHRKTLQIQIGYERLPQDVFQVVLLDNRVTNLSEAAELIAESARQGLSVFLETELGSGFSDPTFLEKGSITFEEVLAQIHGGLALEEMERVIEWRWGSLSEIGCRNGGPLTLCLDHPAESLEVILMKDAQLWAQPA